ncbi:MAG: YggS family pyridoxal phosphate-dependent enzyme [Candidatus Omnitrophica bacterium]|nr:YggS family pyridoxal phosphate-dependent enzyme [Candidatus Omnitrophota bacterium]MDD5593050.1 YggS family pyridoxal phosphate-dependent enzyme [Candidatus Omnitrophota bacterium]
MVKENILKIKEHISLACAKIKQDPGKITIVAVSKDRTIGQIKEAIEAGVTDIGENRVQEALSKYNELTAYDLQLTTTKWHMVGHLQTNKAKDAVKIFDLIQSVDSLRLAQAIDKEAAKLGKIQDILLEIKTSPEESKTGLKAEEAIEVIEDIARMKNINIKGLMTIAPLADNPEKTRPYFRMLRELRDKVNALTTSDKRLTTLSMGMTDDFEIAIEEGSNMVRLGRAIFEG